MMENEHNVNRKLMPVLLAGDVGGTKTLLGLFDPVPARPRPLVVRAFGTLDFDDLPSMIAAFLRDDAAKGVSIAAGCFGVAGPIFGDSAALTNVPWRLDALLVAAAFGLSRVRLLNDLQAMAYAVPVLLDAEVHVLQEGVAPRGGNIAVIAAGTGLGEALLHSIDGRFVPSPSEGGHADFAARSERDITVMRDVTSRFGRAEVERVVSGRGLVNIHRALHDPEAPAAISAAALERASPCCVETLDLFVDAYGAEAGNVALRMVSTGGVFIGGGIAPKILPALTSGAFMRAFRAKAPFEAMLERMPVKVIMNPESALLGAAVYGASG
jgi:glucokinase